MKKLTKLILLFLTLAMLITSFSACKGDKNSEQPSGEVSTDNSDDLYDAEGYLKDSLPDDLDYLFEEIKILGWNSEVDEFNVDDSSTDEIALEIYERDWEVEERIGVDLVYLTVKGDALNSATYISTVRAASQGGMPYDLLAGHTSTMGSMVANGLAYNLSDNQSLPYLDYEKPWWNQSLLEKCAVNGNFYLLTGDITPTYCSYAYCVYFNEAMVSNRGLTSPYELVKNNEWTLENMVLMTKNIYQDLDESGTITEKDAIPLMGEHWDIPALLYGCGVSIVDFDESNKWVLTQDFTGEKMLGIMDNMQIYINLLHYKIGGLPFAKTFMNGNSLFYVIESGTASRLFSEVEFEYGCVPCPKYDPKQEEYVSAARQPITMYAITRNVKSDRLEMISASLEAMASGGYRAVTPVVFDTIMKFRDSQSTEMTEMLEIIRDTIYFDVGRVYSYALDYISDQPGVSLRNNVSWSTYLNQNQTRISNMLNDLFDTLAK